MVIAIFVIAFVVFLLLGVPVVFSLGGTAIVSAIALWGIEGIPFEVMAQSMVSGMDSFTTIGIPLFLLAGSLMNAGTITDRIFDFAQAVVGHVRGALGYVNILASVIFSGMSGSAASDAAGLGQIEIQAMEKHGYDTDFAVAVTGASALISPIIPPSVPMVTYGVLAGTSVTRLFIGGIVPGIMMAVGMAALVWYYSRKRNYPKGERLTSKQFWRTIKEAILPLMTPIIIIGGIWSGKFTPTEAAAITVLYAIILSVVIYRCMSLRALWQTLQKALLDCACIVFVMGGVSMYGYVLTRTRVPILLANTIAEITTNPLIILIILNFFFLICGCFMSTLESIILFTPIFLPLLQQVHVDLTVFGVIMCVNLMIGQLTPPFGTCLFILAKIGNLPMNRVVKACAPFILPVLITTILITFIPDLVTFLPNLFM